MRTERVIIKKLGINGEGIGYINKKICFVRGALVGDEAEIAIDRRERNYMTGHIIKLYKSSSQRIKPLCKEAKNCQGCVFMHTRYPDQLQFKRELIKETLRKYTAIDLNSFDLKPVIGANEPLAYRHEIRFPIVYYKGKLAIGLYQRGSRYLTFMDHCPLQSRTLNETLRKIEDILNDCECHDYNDRFQEGLRFIIVREIENDIEVVFVTGKDGIKKEATRRIAALEHVKNIYYTINTARYQEFDEKGYKRIHGKDHLAYHIHDHTYHLAIKTELIGNREMEEKKYQIVKKMIRENDFVLSLYSGNGILENELPNDLLGLDEEAWSVDDSQKNARQNGIMNKLFLKANINKDFSYQSKKNKIDTLLVHLNKEELEEELLSSFIRSGIKNIIFISDNTAVTARMITALSERYELKDYASLDYEPYTARVESIVQLRRK